MTVLVLLMALGVQTGRAPIGAASEFATEFDTLRRQVAVTPQIELVKKYEHFIARYARRPEVAQAMIDLGQILDSRDSKGRYQQDRERAMFWFRKAADTAPATSPLWIKAQFLIANRIQIPMTRENIQKSRKVLQEIAAKCPNDPLTQIRVEHELQALCGSEGDRESEMRHCQGVLNWFKDHSQQIPKNQDVQAEMNSWVGGSCGMIMQTLVRAPLPKRERAERIKNFAQEYPFNHPIHEAAERALKQLKSMPEHVEAEEQPQPAGGYASTRGFSTGRKILTLSSFLFLCIWSVWVFSRLIRRVRAGAKAPDS